MANKKMTCCICGREITYGFGNNPAGAMWKNDKGSIVSPVFNEDDRCCDECNARYVIAGRIYKMSKKNEKAGN